MGEWLMVHSYAENHGFECDHMLSFRCVRTLSKIPTPNVLQFTQP